MGIVIVPLRRLGNDTVLCSVSRELDNSPNMAMRAESADLWHRRLGHIDSRSLDVLRKIDDNGVDYTGPMETCDVCAIGKSSQRPHPKKATYDVSRHFQVSTDLMGPISPPARRGFRYVSKFVHGNTKWKEIFLIKTKRDAIKILQLFNQLPLDSGWTASGETKERNTPAVNFGSTAFKSEQSWTMVCCLLTDSGFPKFLWGELMQTAVYLSNRVPHAALGNITPYNALYGKDVNLGHLRAIGARAFLDSKSLRIHNPETGNVRESRDVIFIETPSTIQELTPSSKAGDDDFGYPLLGNRSEDDEFGYDNNTSYLDLESPTSHLSVIPSTSDTSDMQQLVSNIQEVTSQDLRTSKNETASPSGPEHDKSSSEGEQSAPLPSVTGRWNQVPGRDWGGTFAPVCRLQSIRMLLAIAAEKDLDVIQLDVKTAFLYADIEEDGELTNSQENYPNSILDRFGMGSWKPLSTAGFGPELSAIIGSVIYLAQITRYDIMYCASQLARAMSNPSKIHMGAAKHLLRYLSGSRDFSITYKRGGFDLTALSDANWGNNPDNRKSMSSYIMMMSKAPVSFKFGLQSLTAMSTLEAELVAAALAMKETIFCTNMMKELGFGSEFRSAPLYINTATLHVIGNQTFSGRTKHVALRFFYIREIVKEGRISIHYIPTEDNLADIGTKHLNKQRHQCLIDKIKKTPQGALRELKTIHDPESSVQPSEDLKSLTSTKISRGENPQNALNEILQTVKSLTEKGLTVNETFVLHLFLDALSDEYAMTKHNLRHAQELSLTGVLKEVMIEYKAIKDKLEQGKGKGAKGAEQAYFADGEGRRERYSSSSQGQGRGRGRGRGRSSSRGRGGSGRGGRSGGSGGVEDSKGSSSGGADGGGGGDYKFPGRCFRCGHRGHQGIGCTTNEKDFVPWCARCEGWDQTKEKCATEEAVLAQVVEHECDVDSVEDQAFCAVAVPPGECGTVGEVGLVGVVEQGQAVYVADTAATCSMFRCADNFVNYRELSVAVG
ncbi:unnamed protein product [Ectocarpus sp. CCAP 1310/34]|nr:unnamed protein product [Ectocarpus sp. CCAP 1310/34]